MESCHFRSDFLRKQATGHPNAAAFSARRDDTFGSIEQPSNLQSRGILNPQAHDTPKAERPSRL